MPKNPYLKDALTEQALLASLTAETIRAMGRDVYYIPRRIYQSQTDRIMGEAPNSSFNSAYLIEMYHEDATAFGGEGDIIGKFGIEAKDRASFRVAIATFVDIVTRQDGEVCRPREGDLIYYPLSGSLFEISFVEHENPLYQLGNLYSYVLFVETFAYNNEDFSTGVCDVDACFEDLRKQYDATQEAYVQLNPELDCGPMGDNEIIEDLSHDTGELGDLIDFSERDPFSGGQY